MGKKIKIYKDFLFEKKKINNVIFSKEYVYLCYNNSI